MVHSQGSPPATLQPTRTCVQGNCSTQSTGNPCIHISTSTVPERPLQRRTLLTALLHHLADGIDDQIGCIQVDVTSALLRYSLLAHARVKHVKPVVFEAFLSIDRSDIIRLPIAG